jgi:hypothetical protein
MIAAHVVGPEGERPGRTFLASPEAFDHALEQLARDLAARVPAAQASLAGAR